MTINTVGAVYEIGLNDVGYMLADNPSRPVRRAVGVLDTQPPGSDDPLSERVGRYDFIGMSDWTGGSGQTMLDRPSSDVTRYFYSEALDPFTVPGQLSATESFVTTSTDTYEFQRLVAAYDGAAPSLYWQTADDELTPVSASGVYSVGTAFTAMGAGTIAALASDGEYWYATNGSNVFRNNTDATGASWSAEDVTFIEWCGDRLMGIDSVASPAEIVSFAPDGTGTTLSMTHGTGFTLRGLCGGDGFVWYGANKAGQGHVRYWQVDSDPINTGIALALPNGETVDSLFYYLGNVFVTSLVYGGCINIYRCASSDGLLIPQLVATLDFPLTLTSGTSPMRFAGAGKFVGFTWKRATGPSGDSGIGIIDLETGGYTIGPITTTGATPISIAVNGTNPLYWALTVLGSGFYGTGAAHSTGYLETSTSDLGTPALKHLDEILVSTLPLPASTSIKVEYSTDGGETYTTAATFDTDDETQHSVELSTSVVAASFRFKLTLTPSATETPTVTALLAKTHATGIVDEIIELPINCEDTIADVNGTTIATDSGPGKGLARFRTLRALVGTKVTFQDVDWPTTGTTSLCEVVSVESTSVNVFNQNRMTTDVTAHVAIVTLRRPYAA